MDATQIAERAKQLLRLLNEADRIDQKDRDEPVDEKLIEHCKRLATLLAKNSPVPVTVNTARLGRVMALAAENGATYGEVSAIAEHFSQDLRKDFEPLVVKGIVDDFLGQFKRGGGDDSDDDGPRAA